MLFTILRKVMISTSISYWLYAFQLFLVRTEKKEYFLLKKSKIT